MSHKTIKKNCEGLSINKDLNNEQVDLFVTQVWKMAMHASVEMLMTSSSQLTLKSVTTHALAIKVNSVAAHGVCKFMISEIKLVTPTNIQKLQVKLPRLNLNRKQLRYQQLMPFWYWTQVVPTMCPWSLTSMVSRFSDIYLSKSDVYI